MELEATRHLGDAPQRAPRPASDLLSRLRTSLIAAPLAAWCLLALAPAWLTLMAAFVCCAILWEWLALCGVRALPRATGLLVFCASAVWLAQVPQAGACVIGLAVIIFLVMALSSFSAQDAAWSTSGAGGCSAPSRSA